MSAALLDLAPRDRYPVFAGLAEVQAALDRLPTHAGLTRSWRTRWQRMERAIRRLEAYKLRLVAEADKTGTAVDAGFSGTEAWVSKTTTVSRTTAAREVALAKDLQSGHDATATALGRRTPLPGPCGRDREGRARLALGVSDTQRQVVEAALVEQAKRYDPDQLRRVAKRALEAVEPDQVAVDAHENELLRTEEEAARAKTRLSFHDNEDGTVTGHFTVPALAASILQKVIDSMTAPRRMRERSDADWAHRRGLAFAELLEHLPTEHLHPKTAATIVVTIDHTVLQGALKAAHLDTGATITAGEARRLACSAGIIPAVLNGKSVALDLGRENRLFSEAQRLAAGLRHDHCTADGCERPYAWCELHHHRPWSQGGKHRPRRRRPVVSLPPPTHPRHRLRPPLPTRRHHQIQQAHVRVDARHQSASVPTPNDC